VGFTTKREAHEEKIKVGRDLLINNQLIVELKSIEQLLKIHEAQILTYMKLAKVNLGLLMNFNVPILKRGIRRFVLS
jgi:GxxExxY protein